MTVLAFVVDDSRAMRRIVASTLERAGFETLPAEHGRAALDLLDAGHRPDLVCIDWNMPVMNGLDLLVALRAKPELRYVTLMMVTTESEQAQIVRALAAGAHEYLIKPFTPDAMLDKLALLGLLPAGVTTP
jgi:two-component system chemotaxis response regulator CheY